MRADERTAARAESRVVPGPGDLRAGSPGHRTEIQIWVSVRDSYLLFILCVCVYIYIYNSFFFFAAFSLGLDRLRAGT